MSLDKSTITLMTAIRQLQLVIKYREAVPGVVQLHRKGMMIKAFGSENWRRLNEVYSALDTGALKYLLAQACKELDYRLEKLYLEPI